MNYILQSVKTQARFGTCYVWLYAISRNQEWNLHSLHLTERHRTIPASIFLSFSWQRILLVLKMILTAQWKMCTNSQDSQAHREVPQQLLYYIMLFILLVSGKEKHAWHWSLISHYLPHKLKEESKFVLAKQRIEFLITKLKKRVKKKKVKNRIWMHLQLLFSHRCYLGFYCMLLKGANSTTPNCQEHWPSEVNLISVSNL